MGFCKRLRLRLKGPRWLANGQGRSRSRNGRKVEMLAVQVETNRAQFAVAAKGFFKFLRQRLFLSGGGFISS